MLEERPIPMPPRRDFPPTDLIELNKDFFQPSAEYSDFFAAVQKDMSLGNLNKEDIKHIELRFGNIEDCALLIAKDTNRWGYLQNTLDYYLAWIAMRVTMGRGRDGFTARLMRSTFNEQKATMRQLDGIEKRRGGVIDKARSWVGI